ncbi:jacalin-related lectin 24-like [Raphanus sativus]|uniref:Jacalin-related lectin 24-like n=1 Tax=Raphanus sativus TaxID=3726 RepID=A0A6J0N5A5_RAPSA|nr:jacalin-related lectin 24-like [Raphanus sativus]
MGPIGQSCTDSGCVQWEETGDKIISHINVSFNKRGVTSIQFGYVENGSVVISKTYGSPSPVCSRRILRLNHETEFVTGIHGEVYNGEFGLKKMEFHSGILERREFGGFFGTCDHAQLKSIGFYVRPVIPNAMAIKG